MNVYDLSHSLAKAIKESEEYKQYDRLKKQVDATNPELRNMLKDFQEKQFEIQAKQMMEKAPGPEVMEAVQNLYGIIMRDPLAAEYLQCELRFSMMMKDVYGILGEAMGLEVPNA